ncbi:MAG: phasin family protein [Nitrospirota bacterium]
MVYDMVRKALLAGLGMQEKVKELLDDLVKKGELNETEGARLMKEWMVRAKSSTEDVSKMASDSLDMAFDKMNLASRDEMNSLSKKVQQLSVRVKKLEAEIKAGHEDVA